MRCLLVVLLAVPLLGLEIGAAQTPGAIAPVVGDSTPVAAAPAAKKKKGLFGKVKGLAKNKIVKTVAKGALCTVVPGGQLVAGALDAAETKSVTGAASTALTGGGSSCMPGMAGMAAPAGPGAAGIGAAGVGALGAGVAGVPGQPSAGMPGMAMSAEQMKQMQEQYKKMGMDPSQLQAMQQMMAGMPAPPNEKAAAAAPTPAAAAGTGVPPLTKEKGRLVLRQLPWTPGAETIRPGSEPAFGLAIRDLAAAMLAAPMRYKVEARVEEQGGKSPNRLLARKRAATIVAALEGQGIAPARLTVSDGGADEDPRIVLAEKK